MFIMKNSLSRILGLFLIAIAVLLSSVDFTSQVVCDHDVGHSIDIEQCEAHQLSQHVIDADLETEYKLITNQSKEVSTILELEKPTTRHLICSHVDANINRQYFGFKLLVDRSDPPEKNLDCSSSNSIDARSSLSKDKEDVNDAYHTSFLSQS